VITSSRAVVFPPVRQLVGRSRPVGRGRSIDVGKTTTNPYGPVLGSVKLRGLVGVVVVHELGLDGRLRIGTDTFQT
jgi:hypothetical protein